MHTQFPSDDQDTGEPLTERECWWLAIVVVAGSLLMAALYGWTTRQPAFGSQEFPATTAGSTTTQTNTSPYVQKDH